MKKFIYIFIAVLFSGISYSQSGWYQVYIPPADKELITIQFTSENTGYASLYSTVGTSFGGLLKTTNAGENWEYITPSINAWDFYFLDNNTGYVNFFYYSQDYICKTTNGGINWIAQDTMYGVLGIKFFDYNTGFVATKYGGGYITTNGGNNWNIISLGCWWGGVSMCCLSADNWLVGDNHICKTTNGGINWESKGNFNICALSFFNSTSGFCVSDYNVNIFKTSDAGNNWVAIDTIEQNFNPKNIMFVNENTGYISSNNLGIYKTTNGGYNWSHQIVSPNLGIKYVYFINPNTGFASGSNGAIFKTTTGGTVFVNNISTEIPSAYSLSQNYPNPFNPTTTIKFAVPRASSVKISVFDVSGREVETLLNEQLQPGTYSTQWNAAAYSSGVYFYKITVRRGGSSTNDFSETKRMLLVK